MNKYNLKTIKDTVCYKSNIEAVKAVYPNDWKKFARELMLASNANDFSDDVDIESCFSWQRSQRGFDCWANLYHDIGGYERDYSEIHSCGYHCDRPACIKQQRDELVKRFIWECAV